MRTSLVAVCTFMLCVPLSAQDVGMGRREGDRTRFEAPYTLDVRTPHINWGADLAGRPLRVLAVPSVQEGRTLVELAQRFPLELTTVTIDPAWDNNKWTMAFGRNYGARAERGDLKLVYSYLEEELASDQEFDVILLPLHHGWEALTPRSREKLQERVEGGTGLVLIRPFASPLSPLVPAEVSVDTEDPDYRNHEPSRETGAWLVTGDHYVTRGAPVDSFPIHLLEQYQMREAPGTQVLVKSAGGNPIIAEGRRGKGTVIALGYRNIGLSWRMSMDALAEPVDVYWEYFYSMLGRALVYAAGRAPASAPSFTSPAAKWRVRAEAGTVVREGTGAPSGMEGLAPGRYFLEQLEAGDWKVSTLDVAQPDRVDTISVSPAVLAEGNPAVVEFSASRDAEVELLDGFGRVVARAHSPAAEGTRRITLTVGRPLTHGGLARVRTGTAVKQVRVQFAASSRVWDDYEVILPWYGPNSYQPWIPALDEQFRRIGITTLDRADRNFKIIGSVHDPVFGIYWYRREAYEKRKAEFLRTGDKSFLTRDISLNAPDLVDRMRNRFQSSVGDLIPLKPFAYYLADESSVTCYADAYDVDWSPDDLRAFRAWLQLRYSSLDALNQAWGTAFRNWESVLPMTTAEAQAHGNFAPWAEHRIFMEESFIRAIRQAGEVAREFDPQARASFSGTQVPTAHNGCNWYEIDQAADYLQPYSGGNQDAMHHLFRPSLRLTGFTGYGKVDDDVQHEVWERLFYGHSGASIFWHYTLMNPDLTLSAQGHALAEAFGRMQAGIGRVFMNSEVLEDGVAIHFSMASIRGAWITDGKIVEGVVSANRTSQNFSELMKRRDAWVKDLERQGAQFRFLATPQIEAGELSRYKTLILPYSIALSDREVEAIEQFAAGGGKVYLDDQTGRMDEKCRWRTARLWESLPANFVREGPGDVGIDTRFESGAEGLTTVRSYGNSRLIGFLPKSATEVRLPPAARPRYDLLRGGSAPDRMTVSPSQPLLLLERDTRITSLTIDRDLNVTLRDDQGRPVDRSVVALRVVAPDGNPVRHYSANIEIRNGAGRFEIPFALSDAPGQWLVEGRDVISGLTARQVISR